jgi:hypothetical protein
MDENNNVQNTTVSSGTDSPAQDGKQPVTNVANSEQGKVSETTVESQLVELRKLVEQSTKSLETTRRELQSTKDRLIGESNRHSQRAQNAENTLKSVLTKLKETDPASAMELENVQLRSETEARRVTELREQQRRVQEEYQNQLFTDLQESIKELGVDINDAKLQGVGEGAKDWSTFSKAVLKKAVEIRKEQDKVSNDDVKKLQKEIADLKKLLNIESNSVDSSTPGRVTNGIPQDKKTFTEWVNKIDPDDYAKQFNEINATYKKIFG